MKDFIRVLFFSFLFTSMHAQYSTDACNDYPVVGCTGEYSEEGWYPEYSLKYSDWTYTTPGNSMPIWFAAKYYSSELIDTAYLSPSGFFEVLSGPGELQGTLMASSEKGFIYIDDWFFTEAGDYKIKVIITGTVLDTIDITVPEEKDLCGLSPNSECSTSGGDSIFYFKSSIVSVDAVYPITAGLIDKKTLKLDTGWVGDVSISKLSGPGKLWGTKYLTGKKWVEFVDLKFDAVGSYECKVKFQGNRGVVEDVITVEVVESNGVHDVLIQQNLNIYPNPVKDVINIEINEPSFIKIASIDGRFSKVWDLNSEGLHAIDVSSFSSGVYVISAQVGVSNVSKAVFVKTK